MAEVKFSVSMSVYAGDRPEWFCTAVDSILHQTCKPDEVVLVVDGPVSEDLNAAIASYEGNPIFKVIRLETNQGHGNVRRIGMEHCSHELVALMDADDISAPDRFEKQLTMFAEHSELAVVGGNITEFVDTLDNYVGARMVCSEDRNIKRDMKIRCPMNQVTVMLRKSMVEQAGGFVDWFYEEDYYLWLRLMQNGAKFANLPDYLVNVRVGSEMYQRRGGKEYFISEARLQKYMLDHKIIGFATYVVNVTKRLIVQMLLPNRVRSWVFQKFARKAVRV